MRGGVKRETGRHAGRASNLRPASGGDTVGDPARRSERVVDEPLDPQALPDRQLAAATPASDPGGDDRGGMFSRPLGSAPTWSFVSHVADGRGSGTVMCPEWAKGADSLPS